MRLLCLAAVLLLVAAPAWADEPMSTSSAAATAAPQPTAAPPPLAEQGVGGGSPPMAMGPCGPEKVKADGALETRPHGEVEAGIGTHGYRYIGGTVCQPVGQNGAVTLSVEQSKIDVRR
jgi:hypothetical protein